MKLLALVAIQILLACNAVQLLPYNSEGGCYKPSEVKIEGVL